MFHYSISENESLHLKPEEDLRLPNLRLFYMLQKEPEISNNF